MSALSSQHEQAAEDLARLRLGLSSLNKKYQDKERERGKLQLAPAHNAVAIDQLTQELERLAKKIDRMERKAKALSGAAQLSLF